MFTAVLEKGKESKYGSATGQANITINPAWKA
jgi:hypothetical protein